MIFIHIRKHEYRGIGAGMEELLQIPIPNRYRWYRPIPSTRCQYRSHPTPNSAWKNIHGCTEVTTVIVLNTATTHHVTSPALLNSHQGTLIDTDQDSFPSGAGKGLFMKLIKLLTNDK